MMYVCICSFGWAESCMTNKMLLDKGYLETSADTEKAGLEDVVQIESTPLKSNTWARHQKGITALVHFEPTHILPWLYI